MTEPSPDRPQRAPLYARLVEALTAGGDLVFAGLLILTSIHYAVTTFRSDRGWSEDIPSFGVAGFIGLGISLLLTLAAKRPLPDLRAIAASLVVSIVFAYFSGRVAVVDSYVDHGRPPSFRELYLALDVFVSAAIGCVMPSSPVAGCLVLAAAFSTPATRYLMRTAPEGMDVAPIMLALSAIVHTRLRSADNVTFTPPPLARPALVFGALVLASTCFTFSLQSSIPAAGRTWAQILAFIVLAECARREGWGRRILIIMATAATLASFAEILAFLDFARWIGFADARKTRLLSFAIHPNLVAPICTLGAVGCTGALITARSWIGRLAAAAGLVAGCVTVYLHHSVGATMGLAAGVAVTIAGVAALRWKKIAKPLVIGVAVMPLIAITTAVVVPVVTKPLKGGGESGSISVGTRREFWIAARNAIIAHPVFGLGPRNTESHARYLSEQIEANQDWTVHPHNLFLEVGETCGIPALAAVVGLIAGGCWLALAAMRSGDARLGVAGLALMASFSADWFFDHGFPEFGVLPDGFWWTLALLAAAAPAAASPPVRSAVRVRWTMILLGAGATVALWFGGAVPLGCSALDRSSKWLKQWIHWNNRFDGPIDPDGMAGRLKTAIAIAPYRPEFRLSYADTLLLAGDARNAIIEIDEAAEVCGDNAETLLRAGGMLLNDPMPAEARDPQKALDFYQHASRCANPEELAVAKLGTARCLGALGRTDEALEQLGNAIFLNPALMLLNYGFRRQTNANHQPEVMFMPGPEVTLSVFTALDRAEIKLRGRMANEFHSVWAPLCRIADAWQRAGRTEKTVQILSDLVKSAPTPIVSLYSQLAQVYTTMRRSQDALKAIDDMARVVPGHIIVPTLRCKVYEQMGRTEETRRMAEECIKTPVDAEWLRQHMKDIYRAYAYSLVAGSRPAEAYDQLMHAVRFEENNMQRVALLMEAATQGVKAYVAADAKSRAGQEARVVDAFKEACVASCALEWGDMDANKLTAVGRDLGRESGVRVGPALLKTLESFILEQRSPAPYVIGVGFAEAVAANIRRTGTTQGIEEVTTASNYFLMIAANLSPRPAWKGN